ncbi:hypothetical protein SO802_001819 [Lithocarpus litseifolius]|uniref:RNase H type-1 domain-containing protein n=1 Tax=Lithocarpus litseifolius TaxID=425828 RepID=A0AAW2DZI2_9ROSI
MEETSDQRAVAGGGNTSRLEEPCGEFNGEEVDGDRTNSHLYQRPRSSVSSHSEVLQPMSIHQVGDEDTQIGSTTSFLAELWALRDGLNLCLSYNFDAVEVELDAKAIVDAISKPKYTNVFVSPLMEDCRLLVSRIPHIRMRHCYREANRCADGLARLGGLQATDFVMFMCPPMDLVKLLESDFNGLYLHRPCLELLCAS